MYISKQYYCKVGIGICFQKLQCSKIDFKLITRTKYVY